MNQGHGSIGSGLGSDQMASTRVVRAHSRLRQADWDAGQAALGNSRQEVDGSEGSRARLRQRKNGSTAVGAQGTQGGGEKMKL